MNEKMKRRKRLKVPINKLRPNKWNPNKMEKETLESLEKSIKGANLLEKNPVLVRPKDENGGYEIVDGEQRWRVAKKLGFKEIPIKVERLDDLKAKQRTVILNKNRGTIDYFPLGKIFGSYEKEKTQEEIGKFFGGYSRREVSAIINVWKRLKGFDSAFMNALSNRDKKQIAKVQLETFRKILFEARAKEEIYSKGIEKYVKRLNDLWRYIQSKTKGKKIRNQLIEAVKPDVLSSSIEILKNKVDVTLTERVEQNIIHGDILEEMRKFDNKSFDCILTDPPYLVSKKGDIKFKERKDMVRDLAEWDYKKPDEFLAFCKEWIEESYRVLKDGSSIYIFTRDKWISHLIDILSNTGFTPRTTLVWHKTNPEPMVRKRDFCSSTEYIVFATKGEGYTFNWKGQNKMHNFIESPIAMGKERTIHPTQKPLKVVKHLLEISTNPEDRVLDPFAGSGTTAVACKQLKRNWVMIELEKKYVDIIKRRILK